MKTALPRKSVPSNRSAGQLASPHPEPARGEQRTIPIPPRHQIPSFLALRFHQLCLGILTEVVEPAGLKLHEYGALTVLHGEPGIDQRRFSSILGIDPMSASQLLDRLERMGLVSRRPHPTDRRARALFLTPEGLDLRLRLRPSGLAAQERILSPLRPEERPMLIDMLTRIIDYHGVYARPGNGRRHPKSDQSQPQRTDKSHIGHE